MKNIRYLQSGLLSQGMCVCVHTCVYVCVVHVQVYVCLHMWRPALAVPPQKPPLRVLRQDLSLGYKTRLGGPGQESACFCLHSPMVTSVLHDTQLLMKVPQTTLESHLHSKHLLDGTVS